MRTYSVRWKASALRELKRLDRSVTRRVLRAVEALATDPLPAGVRKLQGSQHSYRVRVGEYRIVYSLLASELTIEIIRVRHRREAYRG